MKSAITAILGLITSCSTANAQTADTVYTNGKIYTVNEKQPWAEAVAIKDGKFLKVGSNADIQAVTGKDTKVIDLGGKFGMPGIHDTHVHPPLVYGHEEAGRLLFPESKTADEIIEVVKAYAAKYPDLKIIRGEKWSTKPGDIPVPRESIRTHT